MPIDRREPDCWAGGVEALGHDGSPSFNCEWPDPVHWPAIHRLLAPAIAHGGDTDAIELIDELLAGRAQLWVKRTASVPIAAAVTTITGNTLHCQLLGGTGMHDWLDELIATVAAKARPDGIMRFTMDGRPGWERMLTAKGWKKRRVVMEVDL